eukprot:jgi/Chrzof1/4308/Cz14g08110.t1
MQGTCCSAGCQTEVCTASTSTQCDGALVTLCSTECQTQVLTTSEASTQCNLKLGTSCSTGCQTELLPIEPMAIISSRSTQCNGSWESREDACKVAAQAAAQQTKDQYEQLLKRERQKSRQLEARLQLLQAASRSTHHATAAGDGLRSGAGVLLNGGHAPVRSSRGTHQSAKDQLLRAAVHQAAAAAGFAAPQRPVAAPQHHHVAHRVHHQPTAAPQTPVQGPVLQLHPGLRRDMQAAPLKPPGLQPPPPRPAQHPAFQPHQILQRHPLQAAELQPPGLQQPCPPPRPGPAATSRASATAAAVESAATTVCSTSGSKSGATAAATSTAATTAAQCFTTAATSPTAATAAAMHQAPRLLQQQLIARQYAVVPQCQQQHLLAQQQQALAVQQQQALLGQQHQPQPQQHQQQAPNPVQQQPQVDFIGVPHMGGGALLPMPAANHPQLHGARLMAATDAELIAAMKDDRNPGLGAGAFGAVMDVAHGPLAPAVIKGMDVMSAAHLDRANMEIAAHKECWQSRHIVRMCNVQWTMQLSTHSSAAAAAKLKACFVLEKMPHGNLDAAVKLVSRQQLPAPAGTGPQAMLQQLVDVRGLIQHQVLPLCTSLVGLML